MRQKRFLSWLLTLCLLLGMFSFPAYAEGNTTTTKISGDGTADKTGSMTVTLVIPKKTPAATDLTYTAPTNLVYDSNNKAATVAAASGVTGLGTITVKYYSDASRITEATPKNVGTYYVGATVAEGDQYAASTAVLYGDDWTFEITKSTPTAPAAPTNASATKNSITLNAVSGCEYSKDGANWQSGTEFTGLNPGTEYTFYQRVKATANTNASTASSASFSTVADTYAMTITLVIKPAQTITASDVTATYGDTDKSVSASVTEPTTGGGAITYSVKEGSGDYIDVAADGKLTIKAVPPTDGKAYVIVTAAETDDYAEATKEVVVTISPAEVTVTAVDQSIYVGGTVPDLSSPVMDTHYTVTGLIGEDALTTAPVLAYQKDGSAATPDNTTAGTYDIVASGATASDNYTITYANGTLTISEKQPATVTKAPAAKTLTYNGEAQELVTAGEATGGTMRYALGTATEATQPYTTSIPSETNAGTYYVWYKVKGDGNHNDTVPQKVSVDISKAEVTAPAIDSKAYTGQKQTATVPASDRYTVTTNNGGTNVGSYDVVLTLTDSDNYKWSNSTEATKTLQFQITKATTNTVTVNIEGWTYGGSAKSPTSTATFGTATYTYAANGSSEYTATVPTDTGDYTVRATVAGTANYPAGEATKNFSIARASAAAATVTANNCNYDGTKKTLVTVDELTLAGGTMQYALGTNATTAPADNLYTTSVPAATDAGTYYVWYVVKGDANHDDTAPECRTVTIGKADINPVVKIQGWTQGETANAPQLSGNSGIGTVTWTYTVRGENNYSNRIPASAGRYTVKATIAETDNYKSGEATANFTIRKPNTVTWDAGVLRSINLTTGNTYTDKDGITLQVLKGSASYGSSGLALKGFNFRNDSFRFSSERIITGIEITGKVRTLNWPGAQKTTGGLTWTGSATGTDFGKHIDGITKIVFTLGDYPQEMPEADFVTPGAMHWIDEQAFEGIAAVNVRVSDGTESLGSRAFADCKSLKTIYIPESVQSIPDDLLDGCGDVRVFGNGEKARTFAETNGYTYTEVQ